MSVERRLRETLRRVNEYAPSPDLFGRVTRSIAEDRRHRRRIRTWSLVGLIGVAAAAAFLRLVGQPVDSTLHIPSWAIEVLAAAVSSILLLAFGPSIRRLGRDLIDDVFFLDRRQGERFLRLLDIAYYLVGAGLVLVRTDVSHPHRLLALDVGLESVSARIGVFLIALGLGHVFNLLVIPIVGLFHSATLRRVLRDRAGLLAGPVSPAARKADRLVTILVTALVLVGMAGLLILVGVGLSP